MSHLIPFWCYLPAYLVLWYALTRCELPGGALVTLRQATIAGVALLALAFGLHKLKLHVTNREIASGARDFVLVDPDARADPIAPAVPGLRN